MKKIKLIAPIAALTGLSAAVAPMVTLTSCNKNNTNKVYLATGETAEKNVAPTADKVIYKFVQKNMVNPEYTKVSIADFAINGVSHSLWAKTFMYKTDSAGNIWLTVNTAAIQEGMSGDVSDISFKLVFRNKKANTVHYVGTFKITFDYGEITLFDTSALDPELKASVTPVAKSLDPQTFAPFDLKVTLDSEKFIKGVHLVKADSNEELTPGVDYSFVVLEKTEQSNKTIEYECLIVCLKECGDIKITGVDTTEKNPGINSVAGILSFNDHTLDPLSSTKDYVSATIYDSPSSEKDNPLYCFGLLCATSSTLWQFGTAQVFDVATKKQVATAEYDHGSWMVDGLTKINGQYIFSVPLTRDITNEQETTTFSFVVNTIPEETEESESKETEAKEDEQLDKKTEDIEELKEEK